MVGHPGRAKFQKGQRGSGQALGLSTVGRCGPPLSDLEAVLWIIITVPYGPTTGPLLILNLNVLAPDLNTCVCYGLSYALSLSC